MSKLLLYNLYYLGKCKIIYCAHIAYIINYHYFNNASYSSVQKLSCTNSQTISLLHWSSKQWIVFIGNIGYFLAKIQPLLYIFLSYQFVFLTYNLLFHANWVFLTCNLWNTCTLTQVEPLNTCQMENCVTLCYVSIWLLWLLLILLLSNFM